MSTEHRKRIYNYRTKTGKAPDPTNIAYGEIAINYKAGSEAIYIKNSADEVVDFVRGSLESITYDGLKTLRDEGKLVPSRYYRITDFVTTVANNSGARSAGHPFDLIVLAIAPNVLQEKCYAIQHEGDEYFKDCKLAAWEVWYCLDNDTTKYAWADTTVNGKGVIYRMIDEWQNDCPYDFKNVQFKRYYTSGLGNGEEAIARGYFAFDNNIRIFPEGAVDTEKPLYCYTFTRLNGIVYGYGAGDVTQDNILDESIQTLGFDADLGYDKLNSPEFSNFYTRCRNNVLGPIETVMMVDEMEYMSHILANNVFLSILVNYGDSIRFYLPSFDNKIGLNCFNNTFGCDICGLTFGDGCSYNIIDNDCNGSTFGHGCYGNTFGQGCNGNTFGNNCYSNTFGNNCYSNTFGNNCDSNTFGGSCSKNSFGNGCNRNSLGEECVSNSFGDDCSNNSFGNGCNTNTFGMKCSSNTFGNNFQMSTLGEDIYYVKVAIGETEHVKYVQILNGTQGTNSSNLLEINFIKDVKYSQFAGFKSDGTLKVWVEADIPTDSSSISSL